MKKRILAIILSSLMVLGSFAGCGGEQKTDQPKEPEKENTDSGEEEKEEAEETAKEETEEPVQEEVEEVTEEDIAAFGEKTKEELLAEYVKDPSGKSTLEEFLNFLDATKYLSFDENDGTLVLGKWGRAELEMSMADGVTRDNEEVKKKILEEFKTSPYPQQRYLFVQEAEFAYVQDERLNVAKEIMKTEEDDHVIIALTKILRTYVSDPEVMEYFKTLATDENPLVRKASAQMGLDAQTIAETAETMNTLLQDENQEVRKAAIFFAEDPSSLPLIVAIMDNPDDAAIHGAVGEKLALFWAVQSEASTPLADAFPAYINYLKKTPRGINIPSYISINNCVGMNNKELLLQQSYYNAEELVAALTEVFMDAATDYNVKNSALEAIAFHGTKAQVEALKPCIDGLEGTDKENLLKTYDEVIAEM